MSAETERLLIQAAPELVGESALAKRLRQRVIDAVEADRIVMSGAGYSGQRSVADALHQGWSGPFVQADAGVLRVTELSSLWDRAHLGTLYLYNLGQLGPKAIQALIGKLKAKGADAVRVIAVDDGPINATAQHAPLLSALDAHEIPFFGLEERPQDTLALISAFLRKEAGRDEQAAPEIGDDGLAAMSASSIEELRSMCAAVYARFRQRPDYRDLDTIPLAVIRAVVAESMASTSAFDRGAELDRLVATLGQLPADSSFEKLHAPLLVDPWLASVSSRERRVNLRDLAMRFYSRSKRDPRYEAVLALFMLDVLKAQPGATRDEMLAVVKNAGLTGGSANFLSQNIFQRWSGVRDFSEMQTRARDLRWSADMRPDPTPVDLMPAFMGATSSDLPDAVGGPPVPAEVRLQTDLLGSVPAAVDVPTGPSEEPSQTDDLSPPPEQDAFEPIELSSPSNRWKLLARGLVLGLLVAGTLVAVCHPPYTPPKLLHPIAMGDDHVCVWFGTTAPRCWYGKTHPCADWPEGATIAVPGAVREIVAGRAHTCIANEREDVWCWGDNQRGQLGGETRGTDCAQPVSTFRDAVQVAAHGDLTCVRTRERGVWCVGDHSVAGRSRTATAAAPMQISGTTAATEIAVLERAICWRQQDSLRCRHAEGEAAVDLPSDTRLIAGAVDLVCARYGRGDVGCWRLGDDHRFTPVDLMVGSGITQLRLGRRCGGSDSCWPRVCVTDVEGTVFCGDGRSSRAKGASVIRVQRVDLAPNGLAVGGRSECALYEGEPYCVPSLPGYPNLLGVETIGGR